MRLLPPTPVTSLPPYEVREMAKILLSNALPASPDIWLRPGGLGAPLEPSKK